MVRFPLIKTWGCAAIFVAFIGTQTAIAQTAPSQGPQPQGPQPFPPPIGSPSPNAPKSPTISAPVLTPPPAPVLTPPKPSTAVPSSSDPISILRPSPKPSTPTPVPGPTTAAPSFSPLPASPAPIAKPVLPQGKLRLIPIGGYQGQIDVFAPKGDGTILVKDNNGHSFRLQLGNGVPQLILENRPVPSPKPMTSEYGILSGSRTTYGQKDIAAAYLIQPTAQYRHGALGDRIEADGIEVRDQAGKIYTYFEHREAVFEDVMPRLVDIDGDGRDEIIVVRSLIDYGSALAMLGLRNNKLEFLAQSPAVGIPMQWMNPVGFADFDGDRKLEVVAIMMPHEIGILTLLRYQDGALVPLATANGFSNHVFGTQEPDLGAVVDMNGDGRPDVVVPDLERRNLRIVTLWGDDFLDLGKLTLPAPFTGPMYPLYDSVGRGAVAFMANGKLVVAVGDGLPKTPPPPAPGTPIVRPPEASNLPASPSPKGNKPVGDVTGGRPELPLSKKPPPPLQPYKPPAQVNPEILRPQGGIKPSDPH
ncbi:MAG: VCBS repeat-containing protein [Alphaproteobacteria bacterium]